MCFLGNLELVRTLIKSSNSDINQLNSDYLCVTGLKDCHILNIDTNGRLKEPAIVLQPNLDSTGNYIIRTLWLSDAKQPQLALLTADFIKIYDLSVDSISPIHYFLLPTGGFVDFSFIKIFFLKFI